MPSSSCTSTRRPTAALAVVAAGVIATSLAAAPAAHAAPRDGVCEPGEFCLYIDSGQRGSVSDFASSVPAYGPRQPTCFEYRGPGRGKGRCVKNSAASVWNRTTGPVTVFFNSDYAGKRQTVPAGARADLRGALKRENAGHRFGSSGPSTPPTPTTDPTPPTTPSSSARRTMSYGLYRAAGGSISTGWNAYETTDGMHEGIDFKRRRGAPVHALVSGVVLNVQQGEPGRDEDSDLSTIAIYNAQLDKTIVYLHPAPAKGLRTGQRVKVGQRIGTESWHGVTRVESAHTHVEMRIGRRTNAAYSVDDYTLENPNPHPFWKSRGYTIR